MTFLDLTSVEVIKHLLAKHGVVLSRSLGQNFLISAEVVEATVATLAEGPKATTELGAGIGTLTSALAASGHQVRAIEKDDEFVAILPTIMPPKLRSRVEVIHQDLKEAEWSWPEPYQLAGNIPYNVSGFIIRRLTQLEPAPVQAVFLMQREVGQRLTAMAPDMNLLSLAVSLWGRAEGLLIVPPNCFWPAPNVYSQLVALTPAGDQMFDRESRERIMNMAHTFFQQKRKQIGSVMKKAFGLDVPEAVAICAGADISPTQRPQELTPQQWKQLSQRLRRKA